MKIRRLKLERRWKKSTGAEEQEQVGCHAVVFHYLGRWCSLNFDYYPVASDEDQRVPRQAILLESAAVIIQINQRIAMGPAALWRNFLGPTCWCQCGRRWTWFHFNWIWIGPIGRPSVRPGGSDGSGGFKLRRKRQDGSWLTSFGTDIEMVGLGTSIRGASGMRMPVEPLFGCLSGH